MLPHLLYAEADKQQLYTYFVPILFPTAKSVAENISGEGARKCWRLQCKGECDVGTDGGQKVNKYQESRLTLQTLSAPFLSPWEPD